MKTIKNNRGFTLIELLVVVAIIGLLASVVLASLNSARGKAKDAAIKEEVGEFATLMNENYNDSGEYCDLDPSAWITASGVTCDSMSAGGTYASNERNICNDIWNNAADLWAPIGGYRMIIYTAPTTCANSYSIMVALNDGNWYCSGSSGIRGEYAYYGDPPNSNPGCYGNP